MDLCCLRKQQKENTDRERERVPVSNLLLSGLAAKTDRVLDVVINHLQHT